MMHTMNILEIDQLSATYAHLKEMLVLHSISLNIERNTTCGIVGESGSGKSTLAKSLFGLSKIQSGTILNKKQQIQDASESER